MFQHQGIWLPEGERHFPEWMDQHGELVDGQGTYQIRKLRAALEHCRTFKIAIDVGAHVGLWSMQLVKHFSHVVAFEPVSEFKDCFLKNLEGSEFDLHECALGATDGGRVSMNIPKLNGGLDSGGTHVVDGGDVKLMKLDGFFFDYQHVSLIKIDCEGYEHHVIEGARETIARCKPCVIVEQKPHKLGPNFGIKGTPAVDLLKSMGYEVKREMGGDYIMVPA